MRAHRFELAVAFLAISAAVFWSSGRANAQATYGYANQSLTIVMQVNGDVVVTDESANTDSEAEVHGAVDDAMSETFPVNARQSAVGFVPGAAGTHGASPGEDTYFRPGPTTGANWDPASMLGNLNPGGNRSRGDALVVAPGGLGDDIVGSGVGVGNVAESILNTTLFPADASASANWDLSYTLDVRSNDATITLTVAYTNEIVGDVASQLVAPSHSDASFSFTGSLLHDTGGSVVRVDLTDGQPGDTWVPAQLNDTFGIGPGQRFANFATGSVQTVSVPLAVGQYLLDLTGDERTFVQRQPALLTHFQCYETHRPPLNLTGVSLVDEFGASTVDVIRSKRLCAPADKNDEDPTAPTATDHLTAYTIQQQTPRFLPHRDLQVVNQLGTFVLDVVRPDRLLVPTAKSLGVPPPAYTPAIDHYKCYDVAGVRFRSSAVKVDDQFGTLSLDIKRPSHFCTPVMKNGGQIIDSLSRLLCYEVRAVTNSPVFHGPEVFTENQFGADQFTIFGPRELCVPSLLAQ
jgi:hypothetical protein